MPEKLQYRDGLCAAARSGEGIPSGAGSSSRAMVRRAPLPEEEAEGYDTEAFGRSLSALDFAPENAVDAVVETICERSAMDEEELEAQRRRSSSMSSMTRSWIPSPSPPTTTNEERRRSARRAAARSVSPRRPWVGLGLE